jgi:hypothetical protein
MISSVKAAVIGVLLVLLIVTAQVARKGIVFPTVKDG